jgi:hypothetical protein
VGEQGMALPLDEGTVLGGEAAGLAAAEGIERIAEVRTIWNLSKMKRCGSYASILGSCCQDFLRANLTRALLRGDIRRNLLPIHLKHFRGRCAGCAWVCG